MPPCCNKLPFKNAPTTAIITVPSPVLIDIPCDERVHTTPAHLKRGWYLAPTDQIQVRLCWTDVHFLQLSRIVRQASSVMLFVLTLSGIVAQALGLPEMVVSSSTRIDARK